MRLAFVVATAAAFTAPRRGRPTSVVKGWPWEQDAAPAAPAARAPPKKQGGGVKSMFNMDPFGTAGGDSYVPDGMSKAEYDRVQAQGAAKVQANKQRKRGSHMTLAEAQRTGYKTFVSLKGDAEAKTAKKGWLNPFADE